MEELAREREAWRCERRTVVLTNGCFDLVHAGHVALLEAARREGDVLIVALNSDASVRGLKGEGRPIVPGPERAELLLALEAVDRVVVYDEPTPIAVVRALLPDVLVKGADWAEDADRGPRRGRSGGRARHADRDPAGALQLFDARPHPPAVTEHAPSLARLAELPALGEARARLATSGCVRLSGLAGSARLLLPLLVTGTPALVVVPRERDVEEAAQDLRTLAAEAGLPGAILPLPAPGPPPFRGLPRHADASARRAAALLHARRGPDSLRALVASPLGLLRPSLAPHFLETRVVSLHAGDEMTPEILLEALDEGGYVREDPVTAPGQLARRGGILDVFPSDREEPVRIEFFGDTVESLRCFDPETQRATGPLDALVTLPLSDVFATRSVLRSLRPILERRFAHHRALAHLVESLERGLEPEVLADLVPLVPGATQPPWSHLPPGPVVVIEPELVRQEMETFWARATEDQERRADDLVPEPAETLVTPSALAERLVRAPVVEVREVASEGDALRVACRSAPLYAGDLRRLGDDLRAAAGTTVIFLGNAGRADRLSDLLREDGLAVGEGTRITTRVGALTRGFELPEAGLAVLADGDVFPEEVHLHPRGRRRGGLRSFLSDFRDLKTGDLVVHEEHGIGRFLGLETLEVGGAAHEFMVLGYHGGDKLKVPVETFDRIQKYASAEGARPTIDRLGSGVWEKTKTRVKKAMRDMAQELLRLYAERKAHPGHAFTGESPWQREFEDAFEYEETHGPGAGDPRRRRGHGIRPRPWTGWSAATSATARPRSPCARPCAACSTESRWRCSRRRPCSPSSTGRPSGSASPRSRSRSR